MTTTRPSTSGVRFLLGAVAAAATLVVWVALAQREPLDLQPALSADPVDAVEVLDVTVSASRRGRR